MSRLIEGWKRYWFGDAPLFDLAICRILIVGVQLLVLLPIATYETDLAALAALPRELYDPLPLLHVLVAPVDWNLRPSLALLVWAYRLTLAAGFAALVGLFTRVSLGLFAIGNLFLQAHAYSYGDFHHPEGPLMLALVILALSPAGGTLSIDDLRRRLRDNAARVRFRPSRLLDRTSRFALWPLRLIQWVLAIVYLSAAFHKLQTAGLDWMNGYTLRYRFVQDGLRWGSELSLWFATHQTLAEVLSWATVLFEGTFVLAVIFPALAWVYLPTGAAMHTGILLTLRAPFVHWVALYGVFVPWSRALARLRDWWRSRAGEPIDVYYDGECRLCIRSATVLDYLDWGSRLRLLDLNSRGRELSAERDDIALSDLRREMHVLRPDGTVRRGFFAFRDIAPRLPVLSPLTPLLWLPGASSVGPRMYAAVASSRARLVPCGDTECALHSEPAESRPSDTNGTKRTDVSVSSS